MLARLLDLNKITTALFVAALFAIGALGTARFASDSAPGAAPDQSLTIELPSSLSEAQREIEAPQLNDTKALATIILGGVVTATVVGFGVALAFGCWLLDRLVREMPKGN